MSPRFAVGIDLGTTNTSLAAVPLDDAASVAPVVIDLPQVTAQGELGARPLLPSFVYLPADAELPPQALALPWDSKRSFAVGTFARDRGAQVPMRVVASSKSWLCHDGVDRRRPLLPFGAPDDVPKISPVEASARLLAHAREAWDHAHPDAPLAEQDVVLTVPASFDAVARALTEEAAKSVGLHERLTLLEEPTAALYAWVAARADAWRKQVAPGDVLLVVDIGGGTTDFSLIEVRDEDGHLSLSRVAVGDHILLGGDNMDAALAYRVRTALEAQGKTLDEWQMRGLVHAARTAKETLLEDSTLASHPIAIAGRGSKLMGGTLRTELTRAVLDETLLQGFFPEVDKAARPTTARRAGLSALGLPYAQDAAITKHLAAFVARNRAPTALLFNGGVAKSAVLRDRIQAVVASWLDGAPLRVLEGADLDTAVAKGAAYYGRVRTGRGVRIKGGTARAYYVGREKAELAVPGVPKQLEAVCVAPFGMEEGAEVVLDAELVVYTGESVPFPFYASSQRKDDALGDVVDPARAGLAELPPIEATIEGDVGKSVPARLHARVTELGTLEVSLVETASGKRTRLEFNIRVE